MYAVYILSCLVAFVIHSSHGELPDSIQYSCIPSNDSKAGSNKIVIARDLLQNVLDIYAYNVRDIWAECKTTESNHTHFIILGCWNSDVIVAPRNSSDIIIGGKESKLYQLKCVGPDSDHTNVTVDIRESIKYAGSANVYGMDTVNAFGFDMIILDQHNQAKDAFLIGDPMTMQIKPKGDHQNTQWRVLSCTAYSAPVEIKFVKDAKVDPNTRIVEEMQNITEALYQIRLYAFHGVHNNEVTYTCTIEICLKNVSGSGCMTPGPNGGRRRRSADDYPTIHTAEVKIHVYDRTEDMPASGAFQSSLSMTMICGASLLMWIYK